jgi:hypothetical protein
MLTPLPAEMRSQNSLGIEEDRELFRYRFNPNKERTAVRFPGCVRVLGKWERNGGKEEKSKGKSFFP